jgi:hypothetical protein
MEATAVVIRCLSFDKHCDRCGKKTLCILCIPQEEFKSGDLGGYLHHTTSLAHSRPSHLRGRCAFRRFRSAMWKRGDAPSCWHTKSLESSSNSGVSYTVKIIPWRRFPRMRRDHKSSPLKWHITHSLLVNLFCARRWPKYSLFPQTPTYAHSLYRWCGKWPRY